MDQRVEIEKQKRRIRKAIERGSFSDINNTLCKKRLSWLEDNIDIIDDSYPNFIEDLISLGANIEIIT